MFFQYLDVRSQMLGFRMIPTVTQTNLELASWFQGFALACRCARIGRKDGRPEQIA